MQGFLFDTNVWVDLDRGKNRGLIERCMTVPQDDVFVSEIVSGELFYGAARSRNPELARRSVRMLLTGYERIGLDEASATVYAEIRAELASSGEIIGANDLWIAAQAVARGLTLVTANVGEFRRVPGLAFENWRDR